MIRIVTDSTSDISKEEAEKLNIKVLPLTVCFADGNYKEGVDITTDEFYEKLAKAEKLPATTQLIPNEFKPVFQKYIDDGDEIIGIFVSSDLSGTCQSARIAAENFPTEHISIIDSRTVTFGLAVLIREAVKLRDQNSKAEDIVNKIEALKEYMETLGQYFNTDDISIISIGSTVGTHAGPGAVGVAYIVK